MAETALAEKTKDTRQRHRKCPGRKAEPWRTMRPKSPTDQRRQSPKKCAAFPGLNAGREKTEREVRIGNIYRSGRRQRLPQLQCFLPTATEYQGNDMERHSIPRTERLGRDEQEENHRLPANKRSRGASAAGAGMAL